jgi:hypothetical protein
MITDKLNLDDLQDPDKVATFLNRFASLWDLNNGTSTSSTPSPTILFTQPLELGVGADLLASLQNLKLGGP